MLWWPTAQTSMVFCPAMFPGKMGLDSASKSALTGTNDNVNCEQLHLCTPLFFTNNLYQYSLCLTVLAIHYFSILTLYMWKA